jgi:hypothetical protein
VYDPRLFVARNMRLSFMESGRPVLAVATHEVGGSGSGAECWKCRGLAHMSCPAVLPAWQLPFNKMQQWLVYAFRSDDVEGLNWPTRHNNPVQAALLAPVRLSRLLRTTPQMLTAQLQLTTHLATWGGGAGECYT